MKKWIILYLCGLLTVVFAQAQDAKRNSILGRVEQIRNSPLNVAHVDSLRKLGFQLRETDSDLSKQLLDESLSKSIQINDLNAISNAYRVLGVWHSDFDELDSAYYYYQLALKTATRNNNRYLMGGTEFNLGNIKYWKGEYDSCLYYFLRAAAIFEDPDLLKDKTINVKGLDMRKSDLYGNLSTVFSTLKNKEKAHEYVEKAIAISKKYKNESGADAYAYYMTLKADISSDEEGLRILLEVLPQLEKGSLDRGIVRNTYHNISSGYFNLGRMDSAAVFARKSMKLAEQLNMRTHVSGSHWLLARIAVHEKQYAEAERHIGAAGAFFEHTEDPEELRNYYSLLRTLRYAQGRYREAYDYSEQYHNINDSLTRSEVVRESFEREARYQTEKKEAQIQLQQAQLKQKNILNYILIGGAAALAIILLLSYRNYKHRQHLQQIKIDELETEKQLTATEAILKGEEQERTRLAKDLHDGLGGMLSGIKYSFQNMKENLILTPENTLAFERSLDMLDSSIKEMRRVAHNLMPEILVKYGLNTALKEFCGEIDRNSTMRVNYQPIGMENANIEQTTSVAVYRIVQELVNNAMKHASATQVLVQAHLHEAENRLAVTVEDDGQGFDTSALHQSDGIGWKNIQNRVDFLKGKIDVQSEPDKGTSVLIEISETAKA
ncbi:MAG: sensor histidine kinase [Niabella sp.]